MRRAHVAAGVICLVVLAIVYLRWPRLTDRMAYVTRSEVSPRQLRMEYRMTTPFVVVLRHETGDGDRWIRSSPDVTLPSRYDLLRGEHYVAFTLVAGSTLTVEADGGRTEIKPTTTADASGAVFHPPGNVELGDGIGKRLVDFTLRGGENERISAAARSQPISDR